MKPVIGWPHHVELVDPDFSERRDDALERIWRLPRVEGLPEYERASQASGITVECQATLVEVFVSSPYDFDDLAQPRITQRERVPAVCALGRYLAYRR